MGILLWKWTYKALSCSSLLEPQSWTGFVLISKPGIPAPRRWRTCITHVLYNVEVLILMVDTFSIQGPK